MCINAKKAGLHILKLNLVKLMRVLINIIVKYAVNHLLLIFIIACHRVIVRLGAFYRGI